MTVAKYHIESVQEWAPFTHNGQSYSLSHLNAHEITYKGKMQDFKFVVTYGMHCFTKDGTPYNIPFKYQDARESISVCLERYEASKQLQHILPNLPSLMLYQTTEESKRAARTVLTGMCYSVGSATRQGSSSLTRFIGQSAITSSTWRR